MCGCGKRAAIALALDAQGKAPKVVHAALKVPCVRRHFEKVAAKPDGRRLMVGGRFAATSTIDEDSHGYH